MVQGGAPSSIDGSDDMDERLPRDGAGAEGE